MRLRQVRPRHLATGVALSALLSACGGGGGGADPKVVVPEATRTVAASAGSDVNAGTLASLGAALARAVLSTTSDGALDITGARERPEQHSAAGITRAAGASGLSSASVVLRPMLLPTRLLHSVVRIAAPSGRLRERPAAVESETLPCENAGGSLTFTLDDADNDKALSAGDIITLAAANCVLDPGTPAATGSVRLKFNAVEVGANGEPIAFDASVTFTGFAVAGYGSYSGAARFWLKPETTGERTRISYLGTNVDIAGASVVFDFDAYALGNGANSVFDINGGLTVGGQTYSLIASGAMISNGSTPPESGILRLRDAAGDSVQLTSRSTTTFDLYLFPAGAAAPTATIASQRWTDYLTAPQ